MSIENEGEDDRRKEAKAELDIEHSPVNSAIVEAVKARKENQSDSSEDTKQDSQRVWKKKKERE